MQPHLHICVYLMDFAYTQKHCVPPNRYIYVHRSNSLQLFTVTQKFALEQNFRNQANRFFFVRSTK